MTTTAATGAQTRRVFEGRRIWQLTPALLDVATTLIADAERPFAPEVIIGIRRGGGPVAAAFAALLDLPYTLIGSHHNAGDRIAIQGTGHVTLDLTNVPHGAAGKRILLADGICGTGATLTAAAAALRPLLRPAAIRAAALCRNSGSQISPDTWVWDVSDWTVFPWEAAPGTPTELLPIPAETRRP